MNRNTVKRFRGPDPQTPAERRQIRRYHAQQAAARAYAASDEGLTKTLSAKIRETVQARGTVSETDLVQAGVGLCDAKRLFEPAMAMARAEDQSLFAGV